MPPAISSAASSNTTTAVKQPHQQSFFTNNSEPQQLLLDLALVRQRRRALEYEIQSKEMLVFNLETEFLKSVGTPLPVMMNTTTTISPNAIKNVIIAQNNNNNATSPPPSVSVLKKESGTRRTRERNVKKGKSNENDEDEEGKQQLMLENWVDHHLPSIDETHIAAFQFGDASAQVYINNNNTNNADGAAVVSNIIGATQFVRCVNPNERFASFSSMTSIASNARNGVVDQS